MTRALLRRNLPLSRGVPLASLQATIPLANHSGKLGDMCYALNA